MKQILQFTSYILHPVFILLYGAILYFYSTNNYFDYLTTYIYLLQILVISIFIPLAILYFLITIRKVDSVMIYNVSQRKIPLLVQTIIILILMNFVVEHEHLISLYLYYAALLVSCIISLFLVFLKQKASLHMVGITSLLGYCVVLQLFFSTTNTILISILIALIGIVASSRLYMKAHTYLELWLGFLIGLLPQISLLVYFL